MTISENIFRILEKKGMTQKEFGELTNIGASTISDWKRKKTNPGADKILIICDALGVTPEELLSGGDVKGKKGRTPNYYVIDRNSELGQFIDIYTNMDESMKARMLGYYEAIKGMQK